MKIRLVDVDVDYLKGLDSLDFKTCVSEKTGELATKTIAYYHFCKITIYDNGTTLFAGSIHKLGNSLHKVKAPKWKGKEGYKGFNGNQFNLGDILFVRRHLEQLFNCQPHQMIFQNIEFGVNTTTSFEPNLFLKGLLYHNGKPVEYRYNRSYAQIPHQRYILKLYNKSKQYGMDYNVLRIELKIKKMCELNGLDINTFEDINTNTLNHVKEMLIRRFDEVAYYDSTINEKSLSKGDLKAINNYSNSRYWIDCLKSKHRDRHKKKLKRIIEHHSKNLHSKIREEIMRKCVIINRLSYLANV